MIEITDLSVFVFYTTNLDLNVILSICNSPIIEFEHTFEPPTGEEQLDWTVTYGGK